MTRSTMLVVGVVLCVILSSEASDVLQCTGEKQTDGHFFFNILYEVKEPVSDCETQWLINGKLVGLSDADGNANFTSPITMATANTSILQTCPKNFTCLLICPAANINEEKYCSCPATFTTALPEVDFPEWKVGVGVGIGIGVILIFIVLYLRNKSSSYAPASPVPV